MWASQDHRYRSAQPLDLAILTFENIALLVDLLRKLLDLAVSEELIVNVSRADAKLLLPRGLPKRRFYLIAVHG
jgi:hypothetical protein